VSRSGGLTTDLDALREWLAQAEGITVDFPAPLEPHQLRLMDSIGVTPRVRTLTEGEKPSQATPGDTAVPGPLSVNVRTRIERVPEDKWLTRHLARYASLQRDGWSVTALRDQNTLTVVLLACRQDEPGA
jgi:hypothetical protein